MVIVRGRAWLSMAVALALLVGGCGDDETDPKSSEEPASASPDAEAVGVVKRYVQAIADGDFDGAMALRCEASRTPKDKRALWLSQLERFEGAEGEVTGVEGEVARPTGMTPADDLPDLVEVSYRVEIDGEPRDQLLAATVTEDGDRRVCGNATTAAKGLSNEYQDLPPVGPETAKAPRELLPTTAPDGHRQVEDKEAEPAEDPRPGELDGWTRAWQRGEYGGARATAVRFDTAQHAQEAIAYYLSKKAADSVKAIDLRNHEYAVGTRLLGFAWLSVQPPDSGPYVDYVYAAFGSTMVVVAAADLPAGSDHSLAESLFSAIAEKVTA
jgi:hypothetical protein